eukprot:jgi/Mesen1/10503/ME000083S10006
MVREQDPVRFYEKLRQIAKKSSSNTVHIFAAGIYVDSLLSVKVLTDLLRSDSIKYSVFPVYGHEDILRHSEKGMTDPTQPYVGIFINCGATIDLQDYLHASPEATLFVLDCHRPIHHRNMNVSNRRVIVAWTADDEQHEDPTFMRAVDVDSESDLDEDDDSDDGEDSEHDSESEETAPGHHADGRQQKRKRRRTTDPIERAARRERNVSRAEYYKRGSWYGRPSGYFLYDMAHLMHKDSSEHLWLACVAITDHLVHMRFPLEQYELLALELKTKIDSVGEMPDSTSLGEGITVRIPQMNHVLCTEEMRLMCLPRWSLYESMKHSTYPCTKLKTWTVPGEKRLKLLFGELGIALEKARQKWVFMDSNLQQRLKDLVNIELQSYGLDRIFFTNFRMHHGYKFKVSAADLVYGVTALLESGKSLQERSDGFWQAVNALSARGASVLEQGMDLAIKVQQAIVRQGSLVIAKKVKLLLLLLARSSVDQTLTRRGKLQYLLLEDQVDSELLAHPLAITRLIHFLMDADKESGIRPRPMAVANIVRGQEMALVVGVTHQPRLGQYVGK